jgi:hypothetical protein
MKEESVGHTPEEDSITEYEMIEEKYVYAFYVNGSIHDMFNTTNIPLHITAAGFMKINDYITPSF